MGSSGLNPCGQDGPVVAAARRAREAADVELLLPFVHSDGAAEVRRRPRALPA